MDLVVGAGRLDRTLESAEELVDAYRTDDGLRYLDYRPLTPPERLVPEDLAVTILINSRVAGTAFKAVQDHGDEVPFDTLPSCALEDTDDGERQAVCDVISTVVAWPGFAASVATKVLHKKRPSLIPILDNEAIFGAYMSPSWPERRASMDSVYSPARIREALDWIWFDLTRPENRGVWARDVRSLLADRDHQAMSNDLERTPRELPFRRRRLATGVGNPVRLLPRPLPFRRGHHLRGG